MSRALSLALPVVTVLVVTYAVLVAGAPRAVVAARVYGGPTEGMSRLSLRVEVVRRDGEREEPAWDGPVTARALFSGATPRETSIARALNGVAEVDFNLARPSHGPVHLELRDATSALLASGEWSLDGANWAARARRRGGWIRGRADRALVISVAPERGTWVVGSPDPLLIRVERAGEPVSSALLSIQAEGARLNFEPGLRTDSRGRARLLLEPTELNSSLRVEAQAGDGERGLIDTAVPVVLGGFHVQVSGTSARIEVPVTRAEAFYSVVSDQGRVSGGVLALAPNGHGGSFGTLELPLTLPHPAWLVVSSDVDLNSAAAIGWPLDVGAEPAQTFDVADRLVLDGLPAAFAREQARRSRVRWLTAAFIAFAFALSVVLLVVRVRAADRDLTRHLREELERPAATRVAARSGWALLAAVLGIALGFIALALFLLARSG